MFAARRTLALALALASALSFAGVAGATTYYVSPSGSDSAAGTSTVAPWRTIGRVGHACPAAGDSVLFQGGATFSDSTLMPSCSGSAGTPTTYGSYGVGKAQLSLGVWLQGGDHDLRFDNLDLTNASGGVVASAASGSGVQNITVQNSSVHDTSAVGIYGQPQDAGWRILNNTIRHTGDSGIINWSPGMVVAGNTISDTGWNEPSLGYATHGVYAKGPDMSIHDNDLSANQYGQSLSLRVHGIRAYRNTIHDTPYAVGFFNYDHQQNTGTVYLYDNRLWNVSGYVLYYNGTTDTGAPSGIGVVWDSNTAVVTNGGEGVNLSEMTAASAEVANNVFSGAVGSGYRGCASCSEHHNAWFGVGWNRPSGSGDIFVDPQISPAPALVPGAGSSVIDHGSASTRVTYSPTCDGQPLAYCGGNPDVGAVETAATATVDTTAPSAPAGIAFTGIGASGATASWQPSTDAGGVTGYDVYVNGAKLAATTTTTYPVSGLACSTTYTVGVDAFDAAGNHSATSTATVTTSQCATTAPAPPTVAITSPASGATTAQSITATATASAPAGVSRVTFAVDGATVCSVTLAPYACRLRVGRGWHTLSVTARDAVGQTDSATARFYATSKISSAKLRLARRATAGPGGTTVKSTRHSRVLPPKRR